MTTKKAFFAEADRLGVEVEADCDYDGSQFFFAWGPRGKQFIGSTCHNTSLGDYEKGVTPDWKWMLAEIQQEECQDGEECSYCHPDQ